MSQPIVFGFHHTVERLKHRAIRSLVEKQLHSQLLGILQVYHVGIVWNGNHHPIAIHVRHRGGKRIILNRLPVFLYFEETHGATKLKVVLNILVGCTIYFHRQLIQRIIITFPHLHGKPSITTLHLSLQTHCLGLLAKGFFLKIVFYLQQHPLTLELEYG